jgi:acetyl esterase/lipase
MSVKQADLVDPELRGLLANLPIGGGTFTVEGMPAMRAARNAMLATPEAEEAVKSAKTYFTSHPGAPDVRLLVYRPHGLGRKLPAILHTHGGGYIVGSPEMNAISHRRLSRELGCVIVSVDYRLAPETCHPGPIEDCYAGLKWLWDQAEGLGVDRRRIGLMGESAGGGLAASLALLARDRGEIPLAFQQLIFPMIDDRTCIDADPHPFVGDFVWTRASNAFGWRALLGQEPGGPDVSPYAAAARATDLRGLPPTYLSVGALDLFLEENMDYARRLTRAGVPVELHVYPGAYHGSGMVPDARVSKQSTRDSEQALARFLNG